MGNQSFSRRLIQKYFWDRANSYIINANQQCDVVKKCKFHSRGMLPSMLYITQVVIIVLFPCLVKPWLK